MLIMKFCYHASNFRRKFYAVLDYVSSYLIRYDSFLQNATATLLQSAREVYHKLRQVFYYKMRQFYCKM